MNFSDEAYASLKQLSQRSGKTIADTLRDAVALEMWWQKIEAEGGRILVEREGKVREVVRP